MPACSTSSFKTLGLLLPIRELEVAWPFYYSDPELRHPEIERANLNQHTYFAIATGRQQGLRCVYPHLIRNRARASYFEKGERLKRVGLLESLKVDLTQIHSLPFGNGQALISQSLKHRSARSTAADRALEICVLKILVNRTSQDWNKQDDASRAKQDNPQQEGHRARALRCSFHFFRFDPQKLVVAAVDHTPVLINRLQLLAPLKLRTRRRRGIRVDQIPDAPVSGCPRDELND